MPLTTRLKKLFDNPVYRILYSRAYVKKHLISGSYLPLFFLAILLGAYHIYSRSFFSVISLGLLLYLILGSLYLLLCLGTGCNGPVDPLKKSLSDQVADQLVITGLTPWTWLKGHLLFCLVNWLFITGYFLPYLFLAWLLGGISLILPLLTALAGLVIMISCRFIALVVNRSLAIGAISGLFFVGIIISNLVFIPVINEREGMVFYPIVSLLSLFSPLPMLVQDILNYSDDVFLNVLRLKGAITFSMPFLMGCFLVLNFSFWVFAAIHIIAGVPRAHFDIPDKVLSGKRTMWENLLMPGPTPSHRTLSFQGLFLLFHQNTFSRKYPKVEFLALSMTTCLTGLFLLILAHIATVYRLDISEMVLIISTLLIFFFSFSVCFSKSVISQSKKPVDLLFPLYFNWILRMLFILIFMFTAFDFANSKNGLNSLNQIAFLIPILILLSLVFSIYSSLRCKTWQDASPFNFACYGLFIILNILCPIFVLLCLFGLKGLQHLGKLRKGFSHGRFLEVGTEYPGELLTIKWTFVAILVLTVLFCLRSIRRQIFQIRRKHE